MDHRFRLMFVWLLLGLLLASVGCRQLRLRRWQSADSSEQLAEPSAFNPCRVHIAPRAQANRPQRLLLLASGLDSGHYRATRQMIEELAPVLRSQLGLEVFAGNPDTLQSLADTILEGQFSEREVAALCRQHNAQGIAVIRVNQLHGVAPLRLDLSLAVIDSREAYLVCSAAGIWDTQDPGLASAFRDFLSQSRFVGDEHSLLQQQSTSWLLKWAARDMVDALNRAGY